MQRSPLPHVREGPVVRDAIDECPLRALSAKARQCLPDRHRDLLDQFVTHAAVRFVTRCHSRERGTVVPQNAVELLLESTGSFAHGSSLSGFSGKIGWQPMTHFLSTAN